MANLPISGLPNGGALTGTELLVTVQSGNTVQIEATDILNYVTSSIPAIDIGSFAVTGSNQITDTNNINNTIDELTIGNENTPSTIAAFVGYITNFRWVKGLAVYTGNFTTPTSQLTATAGANPYGGSNTHAIGEGYTKLLLVP
jgi:hypothetical protein